MDPKKPSQEDSPHYRSEQESQKGKNKRTHAAFASSNASPQAAQPTVFHFAPPPANLGFLPISPADMNAGQRQLGQAPPVFGQQPGPVAFPAPPPAFTLGPQATTPSEPELAEPAAKRFESARSTHLTPVAPTTTGHMQQDDDDLLARDLGNGPASDSAAQQPAVANVWSASSYPASSGPGSYAASQAYEDELMHNAVQDDRATDAWLVDPAPADLTAGGLLSEHGNTSAQGGYSEDDWQYEYDWEGGTHEDEGEHEYKEQREEKEPPQEAQQAHAEEEERDEEAEQQEGGEGEEVTYELLDAARDLKIIKFKASGIEVLTEKFAYGGADRTRPVEWKIPFTKWGGGAAGQGRTTPTPMSLYSAPTGTAATAQVVPDKGFDPDGKYQKGHMVPASSGAHNHYALTTPMEQHTNQVGAWKKTEETIDRILGKPNRGGRTAKPRDEQEEDLALVVGAYYNHSDPTKGRGFVHITAFYENPDEGRVPTEYSVMLYGVSEEGTYLLHEFAPIPNEYAGENEDKIPSQGLKDLFNEMQVKMMALDATAAGQSKTGQRHATDTQWTPAPPQTGADGLKYPARGMPEQHVPRPHRVLDVLVDELSKLSPEKYAEKLQTLSADEQVVLDNVVWGTAFGPGQPFNWAQRDLSERHARALDTTGAGRFLSDARPEEAQKLQAPGPLLGLSQEQATAYTQKVYADKHAVLTRGEGDSRPEADHHVPRSTASGTNYFTNLLWVSHAQNMSPNAQNKPVALTNPNQPQALYHSDATEPAALREAKGRWVVPGQQALSTVAEATASTTTTVTQDDWEAWQAEANAVKMPKEEFQQRVDYGYEEMVAGTQKLIAKEVRGSLAKKYYADKQLLLAADREKSKRRIKGIMPWDMLTLAADTKKNAVPTRK